MKQKTVVRTYQLRVLGNDHEAIKLLAKTHEWYNKGAAFFMNFLVDSLGGFTPETPVPDGVNPALVALRLWFPLVQCDEKSKLRKQSIPAPSIPKLFRAEWRRAGGDLRLLDTPEWQNFADTVGADSMRKDSAWFDRRGKSQVEQRELASILDILHSEETADKFCRDCLSAWVQEGKKTDWTLLGKVYEGLRATICRHPEGGDPKEIAKAAMRAVGVVPSFPSREAMRLLTNKRGPTDDVERLLDRWLLATEPLGAQDIEKGAATITKKLRDAASDRSRRPWMDDLRDNLTREVACWNSASAPQMFSMAMQRYRMWFTNFGKRFWERTADREAFDAATDSFRPNLKVLEAIEPHRGKDQRFFSTRQFRGIGRVLGALENGNTPEPTKSAILNDIIAASEGLPYEEVRRTVKGYLDIQSAAETYFCKLNPCLRMIDEGALMHPWFGASKAGVKIPLADAPLGVGKVVGPKYHDLHRDFEFQLFDGKEVSWAVVPVIGKRFFNEVYRSSGDGAAATRDSAMVRSARGDVPLPLDFNAEKFAAQIRPGENGYWYVNVKVPLPKPPMKKQIDTLADGCAVLSADLGWRNPAAYCVMRMDREGEVELEDGRRATILETGILRESQAYRNGRRHDCRLNPSPRDADDSEIDLFRRVLPDEEVPKSALEVLRKVAKALRSSGSRTAQLLLSAAELAVRGRAGSLSLTRLQAMADLSAAFQSYLKGLENDGKKRPRDVADSLAELQEKMNSVRRERARVVASLITKKALACGASMVVLEKLGDGKSQSNTRGMNRKVADWCARRIIEGVSFACEEFGIHCTQTFAPYTSMRDARSDELKARFSKVRVEDINSNWNKKRLRQALTAPSGDRDRAIGATVRAKCEAAGQEVSVPGLIKTMKAEAGKGGHVYVPTPGGDLYWMTGEGWVDSDIAAAMTIARQKLKFILGKHDEGEVGEACAGGDADGKSLNGKRFASKVSPEDLSRGASVLSVVSWVADKHNQPAKATVWRPPPRGRRPKTLYSSGLRRRP